MELKLQLEQTKRIKDMIAEGKTDKEITEKEVERLNNE